MKGWARACSVFADPIACQGTLANDIYRGGWDGFISLSGVAKDGSSYGVVSSTNGTTVTGYAWGSDVVGWVQFDLKSTNDTCDPDHPENCDDVCSNIDGVQTKAPDGYTAKSDGTCTNNNNTCPDGSAPIDGKCPGGGGNGGGGGNQGPNASDTSPTPPAQCKNGTLVTNPDGTQVCECKNGYTLGTDGNCHLKAIYKEL
jgi:hypothetical protein